MNKFLVGVVGIAIVSVGVVLVLAAKAPRGEKVGKGLPIGQAGLKPLPQTLPQTAISERDSEGEGKSELLQSETLNKETRAKLEVERIAATFVERFLSYSSDGGFENIESLKILMTPKARAFADKFVTQSFDSDNKSRVKFYGVSTKAVSVEVISFNQVTATVKVQTQRQESRDSETTSRIFNQNVEVSLNKQDDEWRIDGIFLK
jgi:hypothetical protein